MTVCWKGLVFGYPDPSQIERLKILNLVFEAVSSPDAVLKAGIRPGFDKLEWLLGNFPGPMGATAVLVILACAVYLWYRRAASFMVPLGFVTASAAFVALFPRVSAPLPELIICEILSGSLLFCAFFVANDPVTSPKLPLARLAYGAMAGVLCMLFRYYSNFQQGAVFAVLICNVFSTAFDKAVWYIFRRRGAGSEA